MYQGEFNMSLIIDLTDEYFQNKTLTCKSWISSSFLQFSILLSDRHSENIF